MNCPVTFLVGENGSGKSTLLEAVAVAFGFNPEGGSRNFHFSTEDTHSALSQLLCLYKGPYRPKDGFFLRAESFYNAASEVDRLSKNNLYGSSPEALQIGVSNLYHAACHTYLYHENPKTACLRWENRPSSACVSAPF